VNEPLPKPVALKLILVAAPDVSNGNVVADRLTVGATMPKFAVATFLPSDAVTSYVPIWYAGTCSRPDILPVELAVVDPTGTVWTVNDTVWPGM